MKYLFDIFWPQDWKESGGALFSPSLRENLEKVYWFIRLRWVACLLTEISLITFCFIYPVLPKELFWPLQGTQFLLTISNVIYSLVWRRFSDYKGLLFVQFLSDLLILTALLHFSGGSENPLAYTYVFHVIISGMLLSKRSCYFMALLSAFLFSIMALFEMYGWLDHYTLSLFPHGEEEEIGEQVHAALSLPFTLTRTTLHLAFMLIGAFFTTEMMSQIRRREGIARQERNRLEKILRAAGAGLAIFDKNEDHTKWFSRKVALQNLPEAALFKWQENIRQAAHESQIKNEIIVREFEHIQDKKRYFYQVTIASIPSMQNNPEQLAGLVQDITQRKVLEAELNHTNKMATLGFLATGIAHEVGNPLASITTRLERMKTEKSPDFLEKSIGLIQGQLNRVTRIIRGISHFAKPSQEKWSACDLQNVLSESMQIFKYHKKLKQNDIQVDMSPKAIYVKGVKDQLIQVVVNLGLNAFDAMETPGVFHIQISCNPTHAILLFSDTGKGIPPEKLNEIFTPFFTTKPSGLGLGLSIVHTIVNSHNGEIYASANSEGGTTFTFKLPLSNE